MIRIQNIYYMLSYAFQVLKESGYASCVAEEFENTADLLATILIKGVTTQIKRGLVREYKEHQESMSCIRGKISLSDSIKQQSMTKQQLVCSFDDFSADSYHNRILKTTLESLLKADISKKRKKELRNILFYFKDVGLLNPYDIDWNLRFNRHNQSYQMLLSICYLVLKGLLQTTADGSIKMMQFLDEQRMSRLYEKFILEYYRKEHPEIQASAAQIPWALDDGIGFMLPTMQSDIMLSAKGTTLIIDAKYYSRTTQVQYDVHTLHSGNLYQIFTYVKNKAETEDNVSGMLLYARTDEVILPDAVYQMSGNKISVRTLNLDCSFAEIAKQLDDIAEEHFCKL